ncbi:MAG: hypothetical protein ACQEQV_09375, partial [Fibrobacterota bacterium]
NDDFKSCFFFAVTGKRKYDLPVPLFFNHRRAPEMYGYWWWYGSTKKILKDIDPMGGSRLRTEVPF